MHFLHWCALFCSFFNKPIFKIYSDFCEIYEYLNQYVPVSALKSPTWYERLFMEYLYFTCINIQYVIVSFRLQVGYLNKFSLLLIWFFYMLILCRLIKICISREIKGTKMQNKSCSNIFFTFLNLKT